MLVLGVSEKTLCTFTLLPLRELLSGFCDNTTITVLVCYDIGGRSHNIVLECYLDPVL